jgi:peptide/nickel transport system permease protein
MARADTMEATVEARPGRARQVLQALRRAPLVPIVIILLFVGTAVFAEFLTPHSPTKVSLRKRLRPPAWMAALTLGVGGGIGLILGLLAGYHGGRVDGFFMRAADITMAFPIILFAILLVSMLGGGMFNVVISIGLVLWARYARVVRGEVLSLMHRDFIARARVNGCSRLRIIAVHLFPNVLNTLMVLLSLQVGWLIIVESSLSFLGAGIPPPTPSWGGMIAEGRDYLIRAWWVSLFPGLAIMLTVLAFNLFGDWLRDTLDPRQRQV